MILSELTNRVVIISLPERKDRRDKLIADGILNIFPSVSFFDAVRPNNILIKGESQSLGALGCTLSHRSVIEHFKLSEFDFGLIGEDDMEFNVTKDILEEYLNNLPDDWDIVSIGRECIPEQYSNIPTKYEMKNKYFYRYISGEVWGTQCYLIKNTVYDYIVKKFDQWGTMDSIADKNIYDKNINCYVSNYSLVKQIEDYSDIHNTKREIMSGRWRNDFGFY